MKLLWIVGNSHGFSQKNSDFVSYMRQFSGKVTISLHVFENSLFGGSEFDTPIEDPELDGYFVKRIPGSSRESLTGVLKKTRARPVPDPRGPRKPPGPLQRPRCLGKKQQEKQPR